ncbi:MAG: hypothetical protein HRU40_21360, partial [Saprospiraceae bacterium]|nr:hypothetical protein [Saprospiraceae bacterium]
LMVFIDWNEDGVFDQATERYESTVDPADTEEVFNITIPSTTPTGTKGVRVRLTSSSITEAYGPAPDGEVEDFLVDVTAYDYADLPDSETAGLAGATGRENYETNYNRAGNRGPRHLIRSDLSIGTLVDAEANGQPQINAYGDDIADIDDEEGITPPDTIIRDEPAVFQVFIHNTTGDSAFLQGFVDWNDDGDFEDGWPNQKAPLVGIASGESGIYDVVFTVPQQPNPFPERVAARFRLSTSKDSVQLSTGPSDANDIDGEVHDMWVNIVGYDWGDLSEPLYATDDAGGLIGPSHKVVSYEVMTGVYESSMYIGSTSPDVEQTGLPSTLADGDDNDLNDDEDLSPADFTNPLTDNRLISGNSIVLTVPVTNHTTAPATLMVFIDWNEDGVFEQGTERYESTVLPSDIEEIFNIDIPATTPTGTKGVRVRLTSGSITEAYGPAPDGEVEDFLVDVTAYDYGDLPDEEGPGAMGSTAMDNYETVFTIDGLRGPRHLVNDSLRIGNLVDSEGNGQPQINAVGDDIYGLDDEDGVIPPDSIIRDRQAVFKVFVKNITGSDAYLRGFVDWNDDGDFEDSYASQKSNVVVIPSGQSGTYDVTFYVPQDPNPLPERVGARFRLSNTQSAVLISTGPDDDNDVNGEVEDLWVPIVGYDWGDLPEPRYLTDMEGGVFGPSHRIKAAEISMDSTGVSLHIGATIPDAENEGIPSDKANGDDLDLRDDEDLTEDNFINPITNLPYPTISGEAIRFRVPVTNNPIDDAYLFAFIDWNGDGDFVDSLETTIQTVGPGTADVDI